MATTNRTDATAPAQAVADRLRGASFVHLLVRADGEALAAAGLLAAACAETDTPFQTRAIRTRAALADRPADDEGPDAGDETVRVVVGVPGADDPSSAAATAGDRPSATAFEAASSLGADPDPALALAGVVAGGGHPESDAASIVEDAGFERRPGLAVPTEDRADGLAHTTLAHARYSGDAEAAQAVVDRLEGEDVDRRLASLLAIDATADGPERAAEAVERAIQPLVGGPFVTVGGYADVLGALAATQPGRAVALALGGAMAPALETWRAHASAVHEGVRTAETERHGGLLVVRTAGPVEAVARLVRDFRSPEPAVLAVGRTDDADDAASEGAAPGAGDRERGTGAEAALATTDGAAEAVESAAEAAGGSGLARGGSGYARFDAEREAAFVDAVREAI